VDQRADARARREHARKALRLARAEHALAVDSLDRAQAAAEQRYIDSEALDAALTHSSADMGNVQIFEPDRRRLHLTAHRGFEDPFLDFFEWVADQGSACAAASVRRAEVIVPDVEHSPLFSGASREVMLDARDAAVHSIPIVGPTGQRLGVFSCHYGKVGPPRADDMQLVSVLARAVARSLQWQGNQVWHDGAPPDHDGRPPSFLDRAVLLNGGRP
jgi:hypothetical protein